MLVWRWENFKTAGDAAKDKYVSYDLEVLAPFVLELVRAFQISMAAAWLLQISSGSLGGELDAPIHLPFYQKGNLFIHQFTTIWMIRF